QIHAIIWHFIHVGAAMIKHFIDIQSYFYLLVKRQTAKDDWAS
ncbi:hypothetical protein HPHPH4_1735, partial [Helicobacter pylori Hp H-4]